MDQAEGDADLRQRHDQRAEADHQRTGCRPDLHAAPCVPRKNKATPSSTKPATAMPDTRQLPPRDRRRANQLRMAK
jgi:hypothetical protein